MKSHEAFVPEILLGELIFDMKQKKNFFNENFCRQYFNGLLNYGSTLGPFDASAGENFENILTYEEIA